ncbi:MAG TPA: hypothetical protein VF032_05805 [Thermoleophilaceae bacterium]
MRPAAQIAGAFVVLACALCVASMPSVAEANRWRAPQRLGGPPAGAALFAGGSSLSVAAWINPDQSIDVAEGVGPRFGPVRQVRPSGNMINPPLVGLAALAVSPRGDAVLVWVFRDSPGGPPEYSVRSGLSGQWSPPAALDNRGEALASLTAAIDSTGTVTFAWDGNGGTTSPTGAPIVNALRTQVRLPDGSFLPVQTISQDAPSNQGTPPSLPRGYSAPRLSVAPSGAAVVAWDRPAAGGRREVLFAQRAPGATSFGPRRAVPVLARAGPDAGGRALALRLQSGVDNAGGAQLAWLSRSGGRAILLAQQVSPDGQLARLRRISPPGAADPQLAVNARGDSALAWRFYPTRPARVRVAMAARGHSFGRPVTVSGAGAARSTLTPRLAVDPAGATLVAWTDFRQGRRGNKLFAKSSRLWWSLGVRGRRFTPPARLPSVGFATLDGIAMGPKGHAVAVWAQSAEVGADVMGAVFR